MSVATGFLSPEFDSVIQDTNMETMSAPVSGDLPSRTKELKGVRHSRSHVGVKYLPNVQTEKRDTLVANERKYQAKWEEIGAFEPDAPSLEEIPLDSISPEELRERHPKFFGTTAYPYMSTEPSTS
jgi:hypothetical protein